MTCPHCASISEANAELRAMAIDDRATAIARLFKSGVELAQLAYAFRLPPETIEAIARARPGGAP